VPEKILGLVDRLGVDSSWWRGESLLAFVDGGFKMARKKAMGIILAAVFAFAASSLWYSPVLFGRQFLALSGMAEGARPDGLKIAEEMLRNFLLVSVITRLVASQEINGLKAAIRLAAILWLGFPVTLLPGSVMWQNAPLDLGLIHCGDWMLKILLMSLILWLVKRDAAMRFDVTARAAELS
jgi:Protein of unknown function (DUF1761)